MKHKLAQPQPILLQAALAGLVYFALSLLSLLLSWRVQGPATIWYADAAAVVLLQRWPGRQGYGHAAETSLLGCADLTHHEFGRATDRASVTLPGRVQTELTSIARRFQVGARRALRR